MSYKFRSILLFLIFTITTNLFAESPQAFISNLLDSVKKEQNLSPVIDVIDWEPYFEAIDPNERAALGYNTSNDLKNYYLEKVLANGQDKVDLVKKESGGEDKIDSNERIIIDKVKSELDNEQAIFNKNLASMLFDYLSSKEEKESVEYVVTRKMGNVSQQFILKMKLVDQRWLLNSAIVFNPLAVPEETKSPIGRMPEPIQVLFNP